MAKLDWRGGRGAIDEVGKWNPEQRPANGDDLFIRVPGSLVTVEGYNTTGAPIWLGGFFHQMASLELHHATVRVELGLNIADQALDPVTGNFPIDAIIDPAWV